MSSVYYSRHVARLAKVHGLALGSAYPALGASVKTALLIPVILALLFIAYLLERTPRYYVLPPFLGGAQ